MVQFQWRISTNDDDLINQWWRDSDSDVRERDIHISIYIRINGSDYFEREDLVQLLSSINGYTYI